MKLYQKRIKNDEFEQVEKCLSCGELFWAKQWYDDWERECPKCVKKSKLEEQKVLKEAKKTGKPIKNYKDEILGWDYKNSFYQNEKYNIDYNEECIIDGKKITFDNIDDYIREEKRKGKKVLYWPEIGLRILQDFVLMNGYGDINFFRENGGEYMGVKHYLIK